MKLTQTTLLHLIIFIIFVFFFFWGFNSFCGFPTHAERARKFDDVIKIDLKVELNEDINLYAAYTLFVCSSVHSFFSTPSPHAFRTIDNNAWWWLLWPWKIEIFALINCWISISVLILIYPLIYLLLFGLLRSVAFSVYFSPVFLLIFNLVFLICSFLLGHSF